MNESINKISKYETIAMYVVGFSMVLNLYILSSLIIPKVVVILFSLLISLFYFLKRFNTTDFINQIINWNLIVYISVSLLFWFIAFLFNESQANFNDLIRVSAGVFFFNWVFFAFSTSEKLKFFYLKFSSGLLLILFIQGCIEYYFPIEFGLLVSKEVTKTSVKVATSLSDPNNFADLVVVLCIIILNLGEFKTRFIYRAFYFFLLLVSFFLVNISGSRQGLILWGIFLFGFVWEFIKKWSVKRILVFGAGILVMVSMMLPLLFSYFSDNQGSAVARLFLGGANSDESSNSRWSTIEAGFEFVKVNYFLFGSGSINFDKAWFDLTSNDTPLPHNSFLFLYCQYGIFTILLYYLFYKTLNRAFVSKQFLLIFGLLVPYFFQPNFPYYPISLFIFSYIDVVYLKLNSYQSLREG